MSAWGVSARGGVCPGGYLSRERVSAWEVSAWGCLPRGCTPPPVDRMTDTCENITFPQLLLRTVISSLSSEHKPISVGKEIEND